MLKTLSALGFIVATANAFSSTFIPTTPGSSVARFSPSSHRACPAAGVKMGFFDNAFNNKKEEDFEPIRAVTPVKGQVLITFLPSGAQVNGKPGERVGDAARRAGINVPYGCKEGVCGTCEAVMKQPTGQTNVIRVCTDTIPRTNLDAPDREKMWGDLRGGKKSVSELRSSPDELTITLQNPNLALKKQQSWENIKDVAKAKTNDWLSPDYKPTKTPRAGGGSPPPAPPQKKGWF